MCFSPAAAAAVVLLLFALCSCCGGEGEILAASWSVAHVRFSLSENFTVPSLLHSVAFSFCRFCCCGIFCSWNSSTRCISAAPTAYSCEEKQGMLLLQSTGKSVFFSSGFSFSFLLFFAFFLSSSSFESISSICNGRCRFLLFVL